MVVTYVEKGKPVNFQRVDTVRTVKGDSSWIVGDVMYIRKNPFDVACIAIEDIITITDE